MLDGVNTADDQAQGNANTAYLQVQGGANTASAAGRAEGDADTASEQVRARELHDFIPDVTFNVVGRESLLATARFTRDAKAGLDSLRHAPYKGLACPSAHLYTRLMSDGGWTCDVCNCSIASGSKARACLSCDLAVCPSCAKQIAAAALETLSDYWDATNTVIRSMCVPRHVPSVTIMEGFG